MLPDMDLSAIGDLANVDAVAQEMVEPAKSEPSATDDAACGKEALFGRNPLSVQIFCQIANGPTPEYRLNIIRTVSASLGTMTNFFLMLAQPLYLNALAEAKTDSCDS